MEAFQALVLAIITGGFMAALGLAANVWGADSRPSISDDHNRS